MTGFEAWWGTMFPEGTNPKPGVTGVRMIAKQAYDAGKTEVLTALGDSNTHVVRFAHDGWTLRHPLACRPNLFDCPMNEKLTEFANEEGHRGGQRLGIYEAQIEDGKLVIGTKMEDG